MRGMGELRDISRTIHEGMETFPDDPGVHISLAKAIDRGDPANVTRLDVGAHTGTHADAPVHFRDGTPGADELPLDAFLGPAWVARLDPDGPGEIALTELEAAGVPARVERLLLAAGGRKVGPEAAAELVLGDLRLLGLDGLSIGGPETHHTLLDARVVPLEGLELDGIEPGEWELIALPLKIRGCDGALTRAVLRRP
jgi:arylformamidase